MNILGLREMMMNPKQFAMNVMQNNNVMKNPLAKNALTMLMNGDSKGLEEMANNLCQQNGTTVEEFGNRLKQNLGIN